MDLQAVLTEDRDANGVLHINRKARGCPHCGTIEIKTHDVDGETRVALYHAGAECCTQRVTDQLRWRQTEIDTLERELSDRKRAIDDMREAAEEAASRAESLRIATKAERAAKNMPHVERAISEKVRTIANEMAGLQRRRAQLAREEVA